MSSDNDWLEPEDVDVPKPIRPAPFRGVWVANDDDSDPRPRGSLMRAMVAPPASPEATIFVGDMVLARSHQASAVWELTEHGKIRRLLEARIAKGFV